MAKAKEEKVLQEVAATEEVKTETLAEEKKPKKVSYMLPRHVLTDDPYKTVIVNGTAYQIKCGEVVEVPEIVARVLDEAIYFKQKAEEAAEKSRNNE